MLREITIMRQFTEMEGNIFTPKLYDVIVPDNANIDRVFLVMENIDYSMKTIMSQNTDHFSYDHVKVMLYNLLCALNFVHSAGVMHRDIKPANILMNAKCVIKLCDFGLARTVLKSNTVDMTSSDDSQTSSVLYNVRTK